MRVNRPGALSLLVCHRRQLAFIAQAQAPRWPMSLEMEMFPKKLPGYAAPPVTSPILGADRASYYPMNDKS